MSKYLLFFSKQCEYSNEFLTNLYKIPELYNKFTKIDVADKKNKIPNYVREIPTIIIPINGKNTIYVGNAVFKWLESMSGQFKTNNAISDYDPIAGGFSGGYSYLGGGEDVDVGLNKNFSLLGGNQDMGIPVMPIDDGNFTDKDKFKNDKAKMAVEQLQQMRDKDVPPPIRRDGGDMLPSSGGMNNFGDY